ncbi:hypothetical protein [Nonomuraea sp. B1E8]
MNAPLQVEGHDRLRESDGDVPRALRAYDARPPSASWRRRAG